VKKYVVSKHGRWMVGNKVERGNMAGTLIMCENRVIRYLRLQVRS
jgi:hypothetical protein